MPLTKRQIQELEAVDSIYEYEEDPSEMQEDGGEITISTQAKPKVFISNVDRTRIIKAHLNGQKPKIISEIMDVPQRRVEVIIRHYAKTGRISSANSISSPASVANPVSSPATKTKISAVQIELLRVWTNEDATQTGGQLAKKLNDMFETNISINTVQRHLEDFIFSLNRSFCPEIKNDPSTLELRKEFCQIYQDLPTIYEDSQIIYIGHVRFRIALRNRVEKMRGRLRQRNLSICIAMTKQEVVGYMGQDSPLEAEHVKSFILSLIAEQNKQRGISSGVLIMDEGCVAGDTNSLSASVSCQDHTIIILPPNSPFLNPLESVFKEFRDLFITAKIEVTNESELVEHLTNGRRLSEAIDCQGHLNTVMSYMTRSLASEPIEVDNLYSIFAAEACEGEEEQTVEEILAEEVVI